MSHYFSQKQESLLNLKKFKCVIRKKEYEFYSGSGVFSKDKIDYGTQVLVDNMIIKGRTLDLGCGIGIVGKIAKTLTTKEVVMVDANERAVALAKKNVRDAVVLRSDMYEKVNGKFDTILLNPPQAAGKKVCFEMICKAKDYLNKEGLLEVVARHNKGGRTLEKHMLSVFGDVETIAKKGGYRVYVSKRT
jgi:16S rRNA G1207 methylase RsmC